MKSSMDKKALLRRACKGSYYIFFKEAFKILHPQEVLRDNWHIKYLCRIIQDRFERVARKEKKLKDLLICIPPRSLKSMIVTIMSTAWLWTNYPHLKVITASYSNDLSIEHTLKTRRIIESEWYKELFGDLFKITTDQNEKSKYENDKSGDRRATSVGGTITGGGADIIICLRKGTKVVTDKGEINIEDLENQKILSMNSKNELEFKPCLGKFVNKRDVKILRLKVGKDILELTDNHPVYVDGKGFIRADEIKVGDKVKKVL